MENRNYFDLIYRANQGLRVLTAAQDPKVSNIAPFSFFWNLDPAFAAHNIYDYGDALGRSLDAICLLRVMTGSDEHLQQQKIMHDNLMSRLGEDGLPWVEPEPWLKDQPIVEVPWGIRGTIMGLTTLWQTTGDEAYRLACEKLIAGFSKYLTHVDDYCFATGDYITGSGWTTDREYDPVKLAVWNCVPVQPMLKFYEQSGYQPAFELSRKLLNFVLKHTSHYHPDGTFWVAADHERHFHARTCTVLAALKLALIDSNEELLNWAINAYESACAMGTPFGFFPEGLWDVILCETCCIVDMVELAILLGRHVDKKYYMDAERFGRNQLLEQQIWNLEWTSRLEPRDTKLQGLASKDPRECVCPDITERICGFAFCSAINDLGYNVEHSGTHHDCICCHASGFRGLYDLWHYAIETIGRDVWVHLHTARQTDKLTVSYEYPKNGKVKISVKDDLNLMFRLPADVCQGGCIVTVNDKAAMFTIKDCYVHIAGLQAGDEVLISHPLKEKYQIITRDQYYNLTWKGEIIINIEPAGKIAPLYQNRLTLPEIKPIASNKPNYKKEIDSI